MCECAYFRYDAISLYFSSFDAAHDDRCMQVDEDDECMEVKQAAPENAHRILIIVKFYFATVFLKFNISKSCNRQQYSSLSSFIFNCYQLLHLLTRYFYSFISLTESSVQ